MIWLLTKTCEPCLLSLKMFRRSWEVLVWLYGMGLCVRGSPVAKASQLKEKQGAWAPTSDKPGEIAIRGCLQ